MQISNLLEKFQNIIHSNDIIRKSIQESIQKYTNVLIEKENITIKPQIIYIRTTPTIKNEIILKKQKILEDIGQKIEKPKLNDIQF
ncbi:MAG: hypothetical protein WC795_02075 [Candidatus Paceibacterota bacterium]|jgi:hypothetical protein